MQGVKFCRELPILSPAAASPSRRCAFGTERLWTLKFSGRESPLSPDGDQIPLHSQMTRWVNRS